MIQLSTRRCFQAGSTEPARHTFVPHADGALSPEAAR